MNQTNINKVYKFCKDYNDIYNKFPKLIKVMNATNLSISEVKDSLKQLIDKQLILKNFSHYYFAEKKEIKTNTFQKFVNNINLNFIFKLIIFIVFILFCFIGITYNYYGNLQIKDNHVDALSCAIAFMLISIVFFKMAIDNFRKKKIFIGFVFSLIYVCLFCYNTSTVLKYQYEKYQDKMYSTEKVQTKKDNLNLIQLNEEINLIKEELETKKKERNRQEKILLTLKDGDKDYNYYYNNLNGLGKRSLNIEIKNLITKLEDKNKEKYDLINNSNVMESEKKPLFTGWILNIYLFFPSFVIELLASISLVLLLRKFN